MRSIAIAALCACSQVGVELDASAPDAAEPELLVEPSVLVEFGEVMSEEEAVRAVTLRAAGATVFVESIRLSAGAPQKWRIEADEALSTGLLPGESAEVRIYFRPCPEAWIGDQPAPEFDANLCYGKISAGSIEIESNAGRYGLSLGGRAAQPPPILSVQPQGGLQFHWVDGEPSQSWIWVNVFNLGHAMLDVHVVEIRQEGFDFAFTCPFSCELEASLCRFADPACDRPMLAVAISFYPQSTGPVQAELVIRSNDPNARELILPMSATSDFCVPPSPLINRDFWNPLVNELTMLDAFNSLAGTDSVASYRWSWIRSSSTAPALTGADQRRVAFTPTEPGLFLLGLDVENTCGASSPSPHVAVIEVRD